MNGRRQRLVAYSLILGLAVTACDAGGSDPIAATDSPHPSVAVTEPATAAPSTTTTTRVPPTTATSTTEALSEYQQAIRFIWSFDPVGGDPDDLADALDVTGVFSGLELPILIEDGGEAVRGVVFTKLAEPSGWSIPILVEMKEYGMVSGSFNSPKPWPEATLAAIEEALTMSAEASYGACAQLMIDLNWQNITDEVDRCAVEGCEWGSVWYSVGEALTRPIGLFVDDSRFDGTVEFTSDTGAGDSLIVTVEKLDRWMITDQAVPTEMPDDSAPTDCLPPAS